MMARTLAQLADGVISNVFLGLAADYPDARDITDMDPMPGIGWRELPGGAFSPPPPVESPQEPDAAHRIITNLAFDLRFTKEERVDIEMASLDDPTAPYEMRRQAADIRVALQRANKASLTDLDDPVTRANVQQFEQYGLIGEGRAAEILDTPVDDSERP